MIDEPIRLADLSIIGTLGLPHHRYGIRTQMHEAHLRDGSIHPLHLVLDLDIPSKHLRALRLEDRRTYVVFDLRKVDPVLGVELLTCAERDMPGLVMYTLRQDVPDRAALAIAVRAAAVLIGIPALAALPAQAA